jgi:enoyl-CoA hydratase/carnithine racemase
MAANEQSLLLLEKRGRVTLITLNWPEKHNILTPVMLIELAERLRELAEEDETRCLVIRGAGEEAFSSGYDLRAIPVDPSPEMTELLKKNPNPLATGLDAVAAFPYPVIAMLNGLTIGGACELALTCDIRIAVDELRMGIPPAKLGIVYFPTGIQKFLNIIGLANTKELFLTGDYVNAERAKEMGLVNYVVPRAELEDFTFSMADGIAANAPLSLKGTKQIINLLLQYQEMKPPASQEAYRLIGEAFASEDMREAQRAFKEKRKPEFKGL